MKEYEILVETMASGDLDATLRSLTGYTADRLTVIRTQQNDADRYDFVWTAAGEVRERRPMAYSADKPTTLKTATKNRYATRKAPPPLIPPNHQKMQNIVILLLTRTSCRPLL